MSKTVKEYEAEMVKLLGVSARTVRRYIKELIEQGYLATDGQYIWKTDKAPQSREKK